ncbi:hypothetical protein BJX62DRAFT_235896 [Aspergillus germanicus]
MPPYIYTEGLPEAPTPVPAWGSLPLDIYLLEQWATPHSDLPDELPDQRRKRLVRQWLNLGTMAREPYFARSEMESLQPTKQRIDNILRPLRPDSLRRYAAGYRDWTGNEGMWVRTCYDIENEEAHIGLWDKYVDISQVISPDSLVLEDKALFDNADTDRILELFPERVTNHCAPEDVAWREKQLADFFQEVREYGDEEEVFKSEEQGLGLSPEEICRKYWNYHADCVVSHFFIEDGSAQRDKGLLHVFLDDCGNVLRQMRVYSDEVDNFDGAWAEGHWKESWCDLRGEIGEAYLPGGLRGLPYSRV